MFYLANRISFPAFLLIKLCHAVLVDLNSERAIWPTVYLHDKLNARDISKQDYNQCVTLTDEVESGMYTALKGGYDVSTCLRGQTPYKYLKEPRHFSIKLSARDVCPSSDATFS